MSKTLERQIADAEKAEAETPDPDAPDDETGDDADDETGDDENEEGHEAEQAETQPEAQADDAGVSMEAQRLGLEREATRHYKALEKLMPGFEHDFTDCPTCMSFGYVLDPPPKVSETHVRCEACNGRGAVLTPSLVPGHEAEQCPKCNGNGWTIAIVPPPPTQPAYTAPGVPTGNGPAYEDPRIAELRAAGYIVTPTTPPAAPGV